MNFKTFLMAALAAVFIIASGNTNAQNVPGIITFDTTLTNVNGNTNVYIRNPTSRQITFSVRTLTSQFTFVSGNITVDPLDSVMFPLIFRTNQNISYNDFLIFESPDLNYSIVYYLTATAKYPDATYNFTQGLIDEPLKLALKNFCSANTNNNYTASRTAMFSTIDDYNTDDTIECVYTGRKVYTTGIPSVNPPQSMNTEHTFPQGFFNQEEPMRSDVHHLYPTDETSNNRRNNFDFGIVVSNITWEGGGSKLGNNSSGSVVFEPRDVHKGNVARCLFYFLIRYQNYGGYMDAVQENVLRQWNISDTVDAKELFRENGIETFQNNRSPFVDHPEFIDRIKSTFSVIPNISRPEISASPFNYVFDTIAANDTSSLILTLFNYGTGNLNISAVNSSAAQFSVESFPSVIAQNELGYARIKFKPDQINQSYNSTLSILSNDTAIFVNVSGYSNSLVGVSTITSEIPVNYSLYQNYPNPFNPSTNLKFEIPESGFVTLKIYTLQGKEIGTPVNGDLSPGKYQIKWNASGLPSGVYYYTLRTGNFNETKRMMLLK